MSRYSHAGGVVVRIVDGVREYLLVESHTNPGKWVLPKGHIEPGETPEMTAVREVEEEAGVHGVVVAEVGESTYSAHGRPVRAIFFLMRYKREVSSHENRRRAWRPYEDALRMISFDDARRVLRDAHALEVK